MKISIIVPAYNEQNTIAKVLRKLHSLKLPCKKEIIIVNDGSTDKTEEEVKKLKILGDHIKIVSHNKNKGKGEAVKTGFKNATGDYLLIQDADFEYNPEEIPLLINALLANNKKNIHQFAVYGSRFKNNTARIPLLYLLGNKTLTIMTNIIYNTKLTDMETGYKLLPKEFVKKISINSQHFDFEPEITAKLLRQDIKIIEVPISYKGRTHFAGKKLTPMDALEAIKAIIRYRFGD